MRTEEQYYVNLAWTEYGPQTVQSTSSRFLYIISIIIILVYMLKLYVQPFFEADHNFCKHHCAHTTFLSTSNVNVTMLNVQANGRFRL